MARDMLSWYDVFKLMVPVITAFAAIWTKSWYDRRTERKGKAEVLWRGIEQGMPNLPEAIDAMKQISDAFENHEVKLVQLDVPTTLTESASRLAELDPKHAYIYSDYVSYAQILGNDLNFLSELIKLALNGPGHDRSKAAQAIHAQIVSVEGDLILLAEKEREVLKVLHAMNPKKYNCKVIDDAFNTLTQAKMKQPHT